MVGRGRTSRAGFTIVELLIAAALIALIAVNVTMVLGTGKKNYEVTTAQMNLEVQAARAMDRIALALMGSSRETLYLTPMPPNHTFQMNYEMNLGMEDGEIVWSEPERIELVLDEGSIRWSENPGETSERHVVWANWIREYLEGEIPGNNIDDNGNGLIDELGLAFTLDGNSVLIHLTVEREDADGNMITKTMERRVTCRN